jgi:general secretion pathway protein J
MRHRTRGLTLLEVMVAVAILAMVSVLIYGAFDGLSRGKKGLGRMNDRYHEGRQALNRVASELASAFLSQHQPLTAAQNRRLTIFSGSHGSPAARVDFTTFSHRRLTRDAHESDQCEVSYFGSSDPTVPGKTDLARRESPLIDLEPKRGGEVNVLAEDIELFDLKYMDPTTGQWLETWDTTQGATGQPNRLPLAVKITLVLKGGPEGKSVSFVTKMPLAMQLPLNFAVPR